MASPEKRKRLSGILFLFLLMFFWSITFVSAETPLISIRGTVLDDQGRPVSHAVVRYHDLSVPSVRSDEDGRFVLHVDKVDRWSCLWAFSADGKQLGKTRLALEEGNPNITEVVIILATAERQIYGRVLDYEGHPVEGATVGGDGWGRFPIITTTDADGRFEFPWEKDEPLLQVFAIKTDMGFNFIGTEEVRRDRGQTSIDKIKDGPFEIRLAKPHRVDVRVMDCEDRPLVGCTVGAWGVCKSPKDDEPPLDNDQRFYSLCTDFVVQTDENGIARFDWIPAEGFSRLEFVSQGPDSGITSPDGTVSFYGIAEKDYSFKTKEPPVILMLKQTRVEGTVVYSDGSPASWVQVSVQNENGHGLRNANAKGVFTLTDNVGTWDNIGIESDRETLPGLFRYSLGDGTEVKRPVFKLHKGVKVQGIVFDENKNPSKKSYIVLFSEHNPDPTRPDDRITRQTGGYDDEISGGMFQCLLPSGIYDVSALCDDLIGEWQMLEIKGDEEEIWLDIQLKPRSDK